MKMRINTRKFRLVLSALTLVVLLLAVFGAVPAWAQTTWYVDGALGTDDGTHGTGPGANAFKTIQYAIDDARVVNGDTINVAAGTYTENLVITDKSLILQGENKNTTIIDRSGSGYIITITANTVGNITISGFTIQNGTRGISAQLKQASAATLNISNNIIHNIIGSDARGINIFSDAPGDAVNAIVNSNEIYDVSRRGISLAYIPATITDNNIHDITAGAANFITGILLIVPKGTVTISGNTIQTIGSASVPYDGGIFLYGYVEAYGFPDGDYGSVTIENNTINTGSVTSGILINSAKEDRHDISIIGNTVSGSTTTVYGGIATQPQYGAPGPYYPCHIVSLTDNTVTQNAIGINFWGTTVDSLHYNNIYGNTQHGIKNNPDGGGGSVDATNNWWGAGGTGGDAGKPGESGNNDVSGDVNYTPWLTAPYVPNDPPNAPTSPLCEGETNPTGVKDPTPEFGWTFSDPDGGDTQSAYQIIVGTTEGGSDMWDSGKVTSSSSTDISYAGSALAWEATYHWQVKTWDNHDAEGAYCADQTFTMETAAGEVWVDDNWAGSSPGDPVNGHTFGYDAFATIQDGIDNVAGSTVNVAEGTYAENVTVAKSLTLKAGSNPVIDPGGGTAVTIDASNVTITGFTIQNAATGILATSGTGNVIHFCDIVNNTTWGLNNTSGNLVDAENNWWGDASGPKDDAGTKEVPEDYSCGDVTVAEMKNANGLGDAVSNKVDYCPWTGAETKTETISGSGTMESTSTGGDVTINATGDHTISTSTYVSNPGGDHAFKATGYYDVHLDDTTGVASLNIEFCPATEDTVIYYWNGANWLACSNQVFNPGTDCVVVTINGTTDPDLDYLTGGPFAGGYTLPPPEPVGGIIVPVNRLGLLAPWMGLAGLAALAALTVALVRKRRRA